MTVSSSIPVHSLRESPCVHPNLLDAQPLSSKAREVRASLTTQQELLDAVEDALHSMEQSDLKKAHLYKVALGILTVIGLAILFVIPISMVFGISFWIPVVLAVGLSLFCGIAGNKLRSRYQEIRLKYRSLQVYHRQLCSCCSGLRSSTLAKYHVQTRTKDSLKTQLLGKLRPDLHALSFDGGASLDETLGLFGEMNSRYQCEAAMGISSQDRDVAWKKCLAEVVRAKAELFKSATVQPRLTKIANSSLQEAGVDVSLLPQTDLMDFARSLMHICGFGAQLGEETLQYLDQYERLHMHSATLISWGEGFSPATHLYLSQGRATIDFALHVLSTLQAQVGRVQESLWLCEFNKWKEATCRFLSQHQDLNGYQQIVRNAHKLNVHEGTSEKKQKAVRQVLRQLEEVVSSRGCQEEIRNQLRQIEETSLRDLGVDTRLSIDVVCDQVKKEFIECLIGLGDLNRLFDKIHLSIRLGKYVHKDIQQAVEHHPENRRARILHTLDQLTTFLNKDTWGAVSGKPVADIFKEKQLLREQIECLRNHVHSWTSRYEEFKSQKMTRILMKDFSETFSSLDAMLAHLHRMHVNTSCLSDLNSFVEQSRDVLNRSSVGLSGEEDLPTQEEIIVWSQEYAQLVRDLEAILPDCQFLVNKVRGEGESESKLLLQALTNKESTVSKKTKKKEEELVAAIKLNRESSPYRDEGTLLTQGAVYLAGILENMKIFEDSIKNPQQIAVEDIVRSSNGLFSAMQDPQLESLIELERIFALRSEEGVQLESLIGQPSEDTACTLREAQKSAKNFWEKRQHNLEAFLGQLQKNVHKWQLAQSLVSGILGIGLLIVSLSLLSLQLVWLPIGFAAAALVLQIVPMLFSRVLEKKVLDVDIMKLAKEFLPSTKILPSEFGNQDLNRLAELQEILQLEGYEQSWAKATIHDVRNLPSQKEDFKKTVKQLKKDAKVLDKRVTRRLGNRSLASLKSNAMCSQGHVSEETSTAQSQILKDVSQQREAPQNLTERISSNEIIENQIVCSRLRCDLEIARYKQQVRYRDQLQSYLESQNKELVTIQREVVIQETLANVLSQMLTQSPQKTDNVDEKEISSLVDHLLDLTAKIYNPNASEVERKSAKHQFNAQLKAIANRGLLFVVRDALEVASCVGKNELRFDSRRRAALACLSRTSLISENHDNRSLQGELLSRQQEVEVRKTLLKYLGIGYLSPFLEFSSSLLSNQGRAQAEAALENIKVLQSKLCVEEAVSTEEYRKAHRTLSTYLTAHQRLSPLAYGRILGDEKSQLGAHLMREVHSLSEILRLNISLGRHDLCTLAMQRTESWLEKLSQKGEYRRLFIELCHGVRQYETSSSSEQEEIRRLCARLKEVPTHLIRYMQKKYKAQSLLLMEKLQRVQEMQNRMLLVSQKIEEKAPNIDRMQTALEEEIRTLRELQIRQAE